jgi:hypothetical protein
MCATTTCELELAFSSQHCRPCFGKKIRLRISGTSDALLHPKESQQHRRETNGHSEKHKDGVRLTLLAAHIQLRHIFAGRRERTIRYTFITVRHIVLVAASIEDVDTSQRALEGIVTIS